MKIMITGCLGFIGSHCYKHFKESHEIIGLDQGGDTKRFKRMEANYIPVIFRDLSNRASGVLEGVDIVIHMAAETFVDHSIKDPYVFIHSNIIGTYNLLEEARRNKVKKFIHISTDEVYGSTQDGYFKETDKLNPGNPYSATKAAADMLAMAYHNTYGIPVIILRPENNYGIYQHVQKAIPTFIRKALNNELLPIYGDGKHRRQWLHVQDFCEAIDLIIEKGVIGETYNIGGGDEHENISIASMILEYLGKQKDMFHFIPDEEIRPGHDRRYGVDTFKINHLGWKPKRSVKKDLSSIVGWYKNNQWWLNDRADCAQ